MSITRRLLPLVGVALLVMSGCRSHRYATRPTGDAPSPTENIAPTPEAEPTEPPVVPHYYTANFACTVEGYNATGQLRLQSDSVVWASASKIVELARVRLTPDSVVLYARVLNRYFRGTYEDLHRRFHYRTTFEEVYSTIMSDQAESQLTALVALFGIDATIRLEPLKEVGKQNFPMYIPDKATPL